MQMSVVWKQLLLHALYEQIKHKITMWIWIYSKVIIKHFKFSCEMDFSKQTYLFSRQQLVLVGTINTATRSMSMLSENNDDHWNAVYLNDGVTELTTRFSNLFHGLKYPLQNKFKINSISQENFYGAIWNLLLQRNQTRESEK